VKKLSCKKLWTETLSFVTNLVSCYGYYVMGIGDERVSEVT